MFLGPACKWLGVGFHRPVGVARRCLARGRWQRAQVRQRQAATDRLVCCAIECRLPACRAHGSAHLGQGQRGGGLHKLLDLVARQVGLAVMVAAYRGRFGRGESVRQQCRHGSSAGAGANYSCMELQPALQSAACPVCSPQGVEEGHLGVQHRLHQLLPVVPAAWGVRGSCQRGQAPTQDAGRAQRRWRRTQIPAQAS